MNKKDVSIATISLVRSREEETVLRESFTRLAKLDIPVFITDGGSNSDFLHFLASFSHFNLSPFPVKGVWQQANNSLANACKLGSSFIFYTEPDKYDFFSQLETMLSEILVHEKSEIVFAARSSTAFASFPSFQQMTETTINNCCSEILGKEFDYTYGPFLLNKNLVPYLQFLKENVGWGWRTYLFGIAARLGYELTPFAGNFLCPVKQQHDNPNERMHRIKQLGENIRGLVISQNTSLTK